MEDVASLAKPPINFTVAPGIRVTLAFECDKRQGFHRETMLMASLESLT